jgi:hypothetical protein
MLSARSALPVQREKVSAMKHMEPDKDQRGGPSDNDADDKGFMKLRYQKGSKKKSKPAPPKKAPMPPMGMMGQ